MDQLKEALGQAIEVIKILVDDDEKEKLAVELKCFKGWLKPLLDVDPGENMEFIYGHSAVESFREDVPQQIELSRLRKPAPSFDNGFYIVPPIIEQ